ncbi:ABC transporter permease [Acetatifactor aquisgranensis]|uniref:ABC transporter permease n=1 Tax=Acetatifactor aquisgranensis TaxID=2941233 RepID=UPI00203D66A3|nr:ABC transporter permease subunit [Acetatifactor aquisgranensis]
MKNLKKVRRKKPGGRKVTIRQTWQYHLLMLPGILVVFIYTIIPFFGNVMAFQDFQPILGFFRSRWVGLANFKRVLHMPDAARIFRNSLQIAVGKLVFSMLLSIFFAVLLNEIRHGGFKKIIQTICFLPHFLSWVILATIFRNLLDVNGIVNQLLTSIGMIKEPIMFLGSNDLFQGVLILTDVWKGFGYGAIIFLAALMGISPELYEAADIDGAGRFAKIWHITLPGIRTTVVLVGTLNIANILNAGFDQVYNLYSPIVYRSGDIIDTYVYRMSFLSAQYSLATAIGLMKSVISFVLIVTAHSLAKKFANYRIF